MEPAPGVATTVAGSPAPHAPAGEGVPALAVAAALALALVHLFAGRLWFLDVVPRSRWLSLSGGVSVAYVFVHVLPELQAAHATIDASGSAVAAIESHVYVIVLLGFTAFYGLERYVRLAGGEGDDADRADSPAFRLHVGSFAAYNGLVGILLVEEAERGTVALAAFAAALALHFVVNDYGLRKHHGRAYHRYGRWVLSAAVVVGVAGGAVAVIDPLFVSVLFAFLAGGIVLNVTKEELPAERESRFGAFAAGVAGYTALLLAF